MGQDSTVSTIASTPRSTVVRSLRRRLWQALQREDGAAALRIYLATRADWEKWMQHEVDEALKAEEERNKQKPALVKMIRRHSKRRTSRADSGSTAFETVETSPSGASDSCDSSVGLLQLYMCPSEPFALDDYKNPDEPYEGKDTTVQPQQRRRSSIKPKGDKRRGSFFNRHRDREVQDVPEIDPSVDPRMTTPLHEAARLGDGKLFRAMLEHEEADPNFRNGVGRTCLHMVAGGVTVGEESRLLVNSDAQVRAGISASIPIVSEPSPVEEENNPAAIRAKNAARAVGRFLRESFVQHKDLTLDPSASSETQASTISEERWHELVQDRIDATLAILSWSHRADGTDKAGEGPSTNAVDSRGRTALHYAAELGRSDICMQILSSFGAMLTIVDDHSRTPCELAAEGNHNSLAAHLEASALLYLDPYGVDDELLAAALSGESGNALVPPFSWFETWTMAKVQEERGRRVDQGLKKMLKIVKLLLEDDSARSLMFNDIDDDNDADQTVKSNPPDPVSSPDPLASSSAAKAPPNKEERNRTVERRDSVTEELRVFESLHKSYMELFLASHQWDVSKALKDFFQNRSQAFRDANVPIPTLAASKAGLKSEDSSSEQVCLICCDVFETDSQDWKSLAGCEHSFCAECLGEYISDCAKSKSSGLAIICPHHECDIPLQPLEVINLSPTSDVYGTLIDTANENFVVSAADLRFCPHPGCSGIVKFNCPPYVKTAGLDPGLLALVGGVCTAVHEKIDFCLPTYEGVCDPNYFDCRSSQQPTQAHRFCFECGETGTHWPVTCETLEEWKKTVREMVQDVEGEAGDVDEDYNDVAQRLWMKANTRPCPKCKAPIEKNEGCNHMTCSNPHCRYEFCWICRNDWKLHNTETGGFFRCNRWEEQKEHEFYDEPPPPKTETDLRTSRVEDVTDPSRMEITYGTAMHEARIAGKRSKDMARFLHHYQRFNAHAESAALERNMSETVCSRLAPVVEAATRIDGSPGFNFGGKGLSFVHAAFTELLECRSMLQHSYIFSFFRYKSLHPRRYRLLKRILKEKLVFEQLQSELEMMTEHMSNVVARSHLRATQAQITFLTVETANKRKEISNFMINVLSEDKKEKRRSLDLDDRVSGHSRGSLRGSGHSGGNDRRLRLAGLEDRVAGLASLDAIPAGSHEASRNDEEENIDAIEEALKASLEEFLANSGARDEVDIDEERGDGQQGDWPCSACTYMNAGGGHCAMCGTPR